MNYELEGGPQEPGERSCRADHSAVAEAKVSNGFDPEHRHFATGG